MTVLGSGSRGNSLVVESAGRYLMVDAGFSCRNLEGRLKHVALPPPAIGGLLLTHEHGDHVKGVDRFLRRHPTPTFATQGTREGMRLGEEAAGQLSTVRSGHPFEVAGFRVEAFGIPHDAREPVGYRIEDAQGHRLGLVADLGSRTQLAWGRLREVDILVLETNHDLKMLRDGPYPWHLKQRIAGRYGHLSNQEAVNGLAELVSDRLRKVIVYHLSETNNLPALAIQAIGERLDRLGSPAEVVLTHQDRPTPWVDIGDRASHADHESTRHSLSTA